ncbi:MAG TPA: helix-turn-helix domain-containing protein [Thermoanaerobaculia bacterium]|nr:helix-turn-helix domain-containing protein [Thermoanaerobaculia bacterium]
MSRKYRLHSLLTFAQAAEILGLSRWTVRDLADQGRLVTYVLPGDIRRIRRVKFGDLVAFQRQIEASACVGRRRQEVA